MNFHQTEASAPSTHVLIDLPAPDQVYCPGGIDLIIERVRKAARDAVASYDPATESGRAGLKSAAYQVARSKTTLDDMGKRLGEDAKKKIDAINADRRIIRDKLESLQEEIRKPVTDWEEAEEARKAGHEAEIAKIEALADFSAILSPTSTQIQDRLNSLRAREPRAWDEYLDQAAETLARVLGGLEHRLEAAVRREAEAAELEQLRREKAERDERERQERLASEQARIAKETEEKRQTEIAAAAERARKEAEEKAARDAAAESAAAEAKIREAKEQAAREAAEAEAKLRRAREETEAAERARKAAEERAVFEKAQAEQRAQHAALLAEQQKQAAVEAERKRIADQEARKAEEARARAADIEHRKRINNEIVRALCGMGLTEAVAKDVIREVVLGNVPNMRVIY